MKRTISFLFCVLFVLIALVPLATVFLSYLGYSLVLFHESVFAVAVAVLSVCVVILDIIHKERIQNKALCFLMALAAPFSFINTFLYVLQTGQPLAVVSGWICIACCCYLTVKHAKPIALKIVAFILSALMVMPVGIFSLFSVFVTIGHTTVVQTKESPSGKYYAQVIDSDQGALGGDTLVNVYENWEIDLLLFKIEKKPQQVYFGDWGEFENMTIFWKDDSCIVINSVEYEIE